MAKRAKGKPHADRNPERPVPVPAVVAEASKQQTAASAMDIPSDGALPDAGAASDEGGHPSGEAARGQLGEGAAGEPGGSASTPADQAPASADHSADDVRHDTAEAEGDQAPAGPVAAAETPAAEGGLADAAEGPELTFAQLLLLANSFVPQQLAIGSVAGMLYALYPVVGLYGDGAPDVLSAFGDLFGQPERWAAEAHQLIIDHPDLSPDALWLHLTARDLLPKTVDAFAELPGWQQDGFRLIIALHLAAWRVIKASLDRHGERLREQVEAETPLPRVKLSDTIFEKHDRIDALVDGLRVNPRH
ncbi:hypothetical protein [Bosea lupini]|uniref:hypothetical protein n=1 Tax=Bosea lupini TaxID=1036779 RepID=UPI001160D8C7|nr:hypothetical protein [Bosea lupini]